MNTLPPRQQPCCFLARLPNCASAQFPLAAEGVLVESSERIVDNRPGWSTWHEIPAVVLYPAHLRRTAAIALIVGTLLFVIKQLDVVLAGGLTTRVAVKVGLTYLVPFCVSNYGLLVGRRVSRQGASI